MDRFDEILLARARARYPQAQIQQIEPHGVQITHPDGEVGAVSVAPIAWEFAAASDEVVAQRIDRHLQLIDQAQHSALDTVPWQRLMPLLRATSFVSASQLRGKAVTQPVDDYLCIVLGVDHDDGIQLVSPDDLARWQVGVPELFNAAFANLRQQVGPASFEFIGPESAELGLLRGVAPYGYQTSLAFVGDLVRQVGAGRDGAPPVLFVPSRNDLFVVPADRPELLAIAYDEALRLYQTHPRPLSPMPYSHDERGLLTWWQPSAGLLDRHQRARGQLVHGEYEAQRQFFDQDPVGIAERDRHDVAFLPVQVRPSGQTWSTLVEGPDPDADPRGLLPCGVDHVAFQIDDPISPPLVVSLADLQQICGPGERYPDLLPPRRYLDWPDYEQWVELEARRVQP